MPEMNSESINHRSVPRTGLFLTAVLSQTYAEQPARIRNLSEGGALVECERPPMVGERVTLTRAHLSIAGEVRWASDRRFGLQFLGRISLEQWVPNATRQKQMAVDRRVEGIRQGIALQRPEKNVGLPIQQRIAEEIDLARRQITASLDALASFAPVVSRCPTALQELEVTAQVLGHLQRLLVAEDPAPVIEAIGMEELKRRLLR